ncbi:hypothetical protein THAOC_19005, partial [Thalassiosira oceanica]
IDRGGSDDFGDDGQHLVVAFLSAAPTKPCVLGFQHGVSPSQLSNLGNGNALRGRLEALRARGIELSIIITAKDQDKLSKPPGLAGLARSRCFSISTYIQGFSSSALPFAYNSWLTRRAETATACSLACLQTAVTAKNKQTLRMASQIELPSGGAGETAEFYDHLLGDGNTSSTNEPGLARAWPNSIGMAVHFSEQVGQFGFSSFGFFAVTLGVLVQSIASLGLLAKPSLGHVWCPLLIGWVASGQPVLYGQLANFELFCGSLSIVGGLCLLMAHLQKESDSEEGKSKRTQHLPSGHGTYWSVTLAILLHVPSMAIPFFDDGVRGQWSGGLPVEVH